MCIRDSMETDESNTVELSKKVGNVQVLINFQSRAPQFNDEQGEENQTGDKTQEQQNEEGFDNLDYCDFTVYLIREGSNEALVYECMTYDSEINVSYVNTVNDVEAHKKLSRLERSTVYYPGPDFQTLDERVQTALLEYLKSFGVNEEVAVFIEHMSLDKEQRLYMRWLKQVANFASKQIGALQSFLFSVLRIFPPCLYNQQIHVFVFPVLRFALYLMH
eukprot:TRINITY_DN7955_c0_g1_i3.p1 TRINITY_DN7955_c0_g1~~TRINITY_DN7955_c0_g1_i3.p1  ORF type:complete len:219 (+),score=73.62 TRINITY_DN7955_c0_g1_i3:65-721(+)